MFDMSTPPGLDLVTGAADGTDTDRAVKLLRENTSSLAQAIGLVYGPDGAAAVDQLWSQHTQFYADAATAGAASADIIAQMLHTQAAELTGFINAHVDGDAVEERARFDAAQSYMVVIAGALAGATSQQNPERFPVGSCSPPGLSDGLGSDRLGGVVEAAEGAGEGARY